jgi:hypothetical protein
MEELAKQVKREMWRTLLWLAVSMALGIGLYFVIW